MFILKKIISQFLMPVPLILSISLIGVVLLWFTKKQKAGKILVSACLFLMLLLSYGAISDQFLQPLENKYRPDMTQLQNKIPPGNKRPIKFIVVLGGGHTSDPELPVTSRIGEDSLTRLIEGIRLYRRFPDVKLILSGGIVFDPIPGADIMADLAKELGVNENSIIVENRSRDTQDQAEVIKAIVANDQFFLVTSASHMPRSIALFKKFGMNPIPAPTDHKVKCEKDLSPFTFFPRADNLKKSEKAIHEYFGIIWAKLRGQI